MGILFGLAAALFWGVSDFLVRSATQRVGIYRTLFFMQFIGLLSLSTYLIYTGTLLHLLKSAGWHAWVIAAIVAILNLFSSLALFRSFKIGVMTIVSPIAASSSALTVLLALLSGETLSLLQAIGICAALLGVILTATQLGRTKIGTKQSNAKVQASKHRSIVTLGSIFRDWNSSSRDIGWALSASVGYGLTFWLLGVELAGTQLGRAKMFIKQISEEVQASRHRSIITLWSTFRDKNILSRGVGWALVASVGYGLTFWLLGIYVTPYLGGVAPILMMRVLTPCVLILCSLPLHRSISPPKGNVWWLIFAIGILDTAAFICVALGLASKQIAIVSVLASLFSAVTIVLAWVFLRERLRQNQWLGILIIFLGIILVKA